MKNRYTEASNSEEHEQGGSLYRGFYPIYDALLEDFPNTTNNICELGIGWVTAHIKWSYIFGPESRIVGIDIGTPLDPQSKGPNIVGLERFINAKIKYTKNISMHWNRDAYDPNVVQEVVDAYGKFDWVVNDALQRGEAFKLMEPWKAALSDTGVIIQEKIGREPNSKINQMRMQEAIDEGWLVYDVRQYADLDQDPYAGNADAEAFVGIWSNNQEQIKKVLSRYSDIMVTDTTNVLDPKTYNNQYRVTMHDKENSQCLNNPWFIYDDPPTYGL